jgi:hypothetical protein
MHPLLVLICLSGPLSSCIEKQLALSNDTLPKASFRFRHERVHRKVQHSLRFRVVRSDEPPMLVEHLKVRVMFKNVFRDKKNSRLGLLLAVIIFGLIAMIQLWRAFAGVSIELGGHYVPIWCSAIVGSASLLMCVWMGIILRRVRPLL